MTAIRWRRKWLYRAALASLVVGSVLYFVGFRWLFVPLMLCWSLLMWRASYWDGWLDGSKISTSPSPTTKEPVS